MQIETFRVFRDLVESASFSKAAESNGITQSAVSQQVRAIEKRFRVKMVERGRKVFALTAEGRAFLSASREILDAYDNLDNRIQSIANVTGGEVRVATVLSIGLHELPQSVDAFRKAHPMIQIRVDYCRSNEVYDAVLDGRCDVGLVAYPKRQRGVKVMTFCRDQLVIVCGPTHPLALGGGSVGLDCLKGVKFVAFDLDLPTRRAIDRRLRENGVRLKPVLEFDNIETVKRAVEIEGGVSILPALSVRNEVASRRLCALEIKASDMQRPLGAIIRSSVVASPATRQFLNMLEKTNLGCA